MWLIKNYFWHKYIAEGIKSIFFCIQVCSDKHLENLYLPTEIYMLSKFISGIILTSK